MATSGLITLSETLDEEALRVLARQKGACLTLVVPARHPGAQEGSRRALVHSLIRMANESLSHREFEGGAELLVGLEEIARAHGMDEGGSAFVIFRTAAQSLHYRLPDPVQERLVIAERFCLLPFVADALALHEFFILTPGRKHLRLFRYAGGVCRELELPAGVPRSLDAAGQFDRPDHDLMNRSTAGPSTGAMGGVTFGMGSDREAQAEHLHHFFATVDRELKTTLHGKPLLLMGVQEDVAAYQRVAKHADLMEPDCFGSAEFLPASEIQNRAKNAARAHYARSAQQALAEYAEMTDRSRTLDEDRAILRAAEQGRVHRLFVRSASDSNGPGDDLVNMVVVETLSTGGEVFMLPADKMPAPLTAILRY